MNLLIVAALEAELAPFRAQTGIAPENWTDFGPHRVWLAFTGVGPVAAAFHIQRLIGKLRPDRVIQAGVCGAYAHTELRVGQTVEVVRERLADLGAMFGTEFRALFPEQGALENPHGGKTGLPPVSGLTVGTGSHPCVDQFLTRFADECPAVETMEGYSLFYVCRQMDVPFTELRAVSNPVSPTREGWDLPLATRELAAALREEIISN